MEAYWIHRLDTLNTGLNSKDEVETNIDQHILIAGEHFQHQADCFPYIAEIKQDRM